MTQVSQAKESVISVMHVTHPRVERAVRFMAQEARSPKF